MSDFYYELTVSTQKEFEDILVAMSSSLTDDALEFGDGKTILRVEYEPKEFIENLKRFNNSLKNPIPLKFKLEKHKNIDWIKSYQDSIQPIEAGKFYIHPSWHKPKEGKINILINPALAFGSGHHSTTYSSLLMIEKFVKVGDEVIDVGCGSGILSLASVKKGATVDMCDVDSVAVDSAKENFKLNNEKFRDIWVGSINQTKKKYDVILANLTADILKALSREIKSRVKDGGVLILSGVLDKKEFIVTSAFSDANLTQLKRVKKDDWITLVYKRGSNGKYG